MVAAIGVGILLAPMTVIWLVENDPTVDWFVAFRASADVWMLSQGADLVVAPGALGSPKVPGFTVTMLPLGYSALLAYLSFRLGRRMSAAPELWPGWLGAVLTYGAISLGLSTAAYDPAVYPITWQGTMLPPIFFTAFLLWGSLTGPLARGEESRERAAVVVWLADKWNNTGWAIRALASPALRGGTAIVAMLMGLSAVSFSLLLAVNWITVTRLYEGLHVSVLGGFTVTIGDIILAILKSVEFLHRVVAHRTKSAVSSKNNIGFCFKGFATLGIAQIRNGVVEVHFQTLGLVVNSGLAMCFSDVHHFGIDTTSRN